MIEVIILSTSLVKYLKLEKWLMKNVVLFLAWVAVLYRGYMLLDKVSKSNPDHVPYVVIFLVFGTLLLLGVGAFIESIERKRK